MKSRERIERPPRRPTAASLRTSIALLVGVIVLLFTLTIAYSHYAASAMRESYVAIAYDDSPSILRLAEARTEMRRLQGLVGLYPGVPPESRPLLKHEIDEATKTLESELRAYFKLPTYPEEQSGATAIRKVAPQLLSGAKEVIARSERRRPGAALDFFDHDFSPLVDAFVSVASNTIEVDARHIRQLADEMERLRLRSLRLAALLGGLSIALSVLLIGIVMRAVRRYTRLTEEHANLSEARARELEDFAGMVSHDLRNPIASTSLALEAAVPRLKSEPEVSGKLLRQAITNLDGMRRLVEDLLKFASSGAKPEPDERSELHVVIREVLEEARARADRERITLEVEPFEPTVVSCKAAIVGTIFANLINNAIKYMGDRQDRRIVLRVRPGSLFARAEVEDTGPGIPADLRETLFDRFVRGSNDKQPGLGIGLATVKRIVTAHGGRVGVRSHPNRGSVFWFELPLAKEEQRAA